MTKSVILDVDTGIDDALAICYALRSPELKVEACVATFGNVNVAYAARNTLQILELCGCPEIPVFVGAARSLMHPYEKDGSVVHGANGLGGLELPAPTTSVQELHAVDFLIRTARTRPGEVTLIVTGPLTTLAMALAQDPDIAPLFAEVIIMGGAIAHPGNVTPAAEANILSDPEAAQRVFRSGAKLTLVGLDVTMKTLLRPEDLNRMSESKDAACQALAHATQYYLKAYQGFYPGLRGCAMHDPLAVAVAADPSLVQTRLLTVDVECHGQITRGMTLGDLRIGATDPKANVNVCLGVDADRFISLLMQRVGA